MTILHGLGAAGLGALMLITTIDRPAHDPAPNPAAVAEEPNDSGVCRNWDGSDIAITQCLRSQLGLSDGMGFPTED